MDLLVSFELQFYTTATSLHIIDVFSVVSADIYSLFIILFIFYIVVFITFVNLPKNRYQMTSKHHFETSSILLIWFVTHEPRPSRVLPLYVVR